MKMTKYQHDFKTGDVVVSMAGANCGSYAEGQYGVVTGVLPCGSYAEGQCGVVTDEHSKVYPIVQFESASGKTGWHGWPLLENIRKATPVEAAEYNLKKAQAAVVEAQAAEKAATEAKRKAEEEAQRFTEADVKSFTVVNTYKHSSRGELRMLIVTADKVLFMNTSGGVSWTEPRADAVAFMNIMYYKTNKTLKDFANV